MTNLQSIISVELPLAIPTIMAGIRLSAVYVLAWATLASYIGAGGLGDLIFSGLNNYQPPLIFAGTIPVTIFALLADWLLGLLENKLTPAAQLGMRNEKTSKLALLFSLSVALLSGCSFPGLASTSDENTVAITGGITSEAQILGAVVAGMVEHYTDKTQPSLTT